MRTPRGLTAWLVAGVALFGSPAPAQTLYSWTDAAGEPHSTESLQSVPPAFRKNVKVSRIKDVTELEKGQAASARPPPVGGFLPSVSAVRLLVFTAPWCGYCRALDKSRKLDDLVAAMPQLAIERVNFDTETERVQRYRVRGIPALVLVDRAGAELGRVDTGGTAAQLAESVRRLASSAR